MARQRVPGRTKIHFGSLVDVDLVTQFNNLCSSKGLKVSEGLRRCLVDAVLQSRIPGITDFDLNLMENANVVEATIRQDTYTKERIRQRRLSATVEPEALENLPVHTPVASEKEPKTRQTSVQVKSPSKHTQSAVRS